MSIIYGAVEFLASFVELFVAYLVLSSVFPKERKVEKKKIDPMMSFVGVIMILLCNKIEFFSYLTLVLVAVYLVISGKLIYKANTVVVFSVVSFYLLCMCSFDFLIVTLISHFCGESHFMLTFISGMGLIRSIVISVIKILWLLLYFLLRRILVPINKKGLSLILLTSEIGFLWGVFLSDQTIKAFNQTMPMLWFVFICLLAFVLFSLYYVVMCQKEKNKFEILEMRNKVLCENYNSLHEIYMSNSKSYHDLNNHLNVLYQLLEEGKNSEAQAYIEEISKPILQLSKTVWTGIDVVDVVLNSKLQKMQELGIASDINVEFPQHSNILPNDLCTILANLLDNAIEAVEHLETDRDISITIRRVNYLLFIRVINPCSSVQQLAAIPATTKENKSLHGWGLKNVCDAVDKYNGTVKFNNDNGKFTANVMLSFDKEENI